MKKYLLIAALTLMVPAAWVVMAQVDNRPQVRRDATTMRPEIDIDTSNGGLRIHGVIRVINPDVLDHNVTVRVTISETVGGEPVFSHDVTSFLYHSDHPRNFSYPVHVEWHDMDVTGFAVKVAAVTEFGHEFCSFTRHRK